MKNIKTCLCGADPIIEKKLFKILIDDDDPGGPFFEIKVEKYHCPNCRNKELPLMDARTAGEAWNRIAGEEKYHRRSLNYNIHGVCIEKPFKVYEWRGKPDHIHVTVNIYIDNGMYYYCWDYYVKNHGSGGGLSIFDSCFPSMASVKKAAANSLIKSDKQIEKIIKKLFFTPIQVELF